MPCPLPPQLPWGGLLYPQENVRAADWLWLAAVLVLSRALPTLRVNERSTEATWLLPSLKAGGGHTANLGHPGDLGHFL